MNQNENVILIVDDDSDNLFVLQSDLEHMGYQVEPALGGKVAINYAKEKQYSLVILDVEMPEMNGYEVFSALREFKNYENVPFLFLSANRINRKDVIEGLKKGAFDYIVKPYDFEEISCRIGLLLELYRKSQELASKNEQLTELAIKDALTGLFNRRYGIDSLKKEVVRSNRNQKDLSILMIDIDDFKGVNDKYGHNTGDEVLKELSKVFLHSVRETDICFRAGGDEFVIILPETDEKSCEVICNRILKHEKVIYTLDQKKLEFQISIGGAVFSKPQSDINHLTEVADLALISAKTAGKNRFKIIKEGEDNQEEFKKGVLNISEVRTSVKSVLTDVLYEVLKEFDIYEDIHVGHVELMLELIQKLSDPLKLSNYDYKKLCNSVKLKKLEHLGVSKEILSKKEFLSDAQKFVLSDALESNLAKLKNTGFYDDECAILIEHHEYLNGAGYPAGKKKSEINLFAKIIAVLEAFSQLALGGSRNEAYGYEKALEMIKKEEGLHFEKKLLHELEQVIMANYLSKESVKPKRILLIDDIVNMTDLIKKFLLRFLPVEVDVANSQKDAFQLAQNTKYELILTDVSLPGSNKLSFLEDLAKITKTEKIVISSGYSAMAWEKKDDYNIIKAFRKPVNLHHLQTEIKNYLFGNKKCP